MNVHFTAFGLATLADPGVGAGIPRVELHPPAFDLPPSAGDRSEAPTHYWYKDQAIVPTRGRPGRTGSGIG